MSPIRSRLTRRARSAVLNPAGAVSAKEGGLSAGWATEISGGASQVSVAG